jgi:hypothetical protein
MVPTPTTNVTYDKLLEEVIKILDKNKEINDKTNIIDNEIQKIEKEIIILEETAKPMMADGYHGYDYWKPVVKKINELDVKQKELIQTNINLKDTNLIDIEKKKLIEYKDIIKEKIRELESAKRIEEIRTPKITQKLYTRLFSKDNNTTIDKTKNINDLNTKIKTFQDLLKTIEEQIVLYPNTTIGGKNKKTKKQKNKKTKKQKNKKETIILFLLSEINKII